MIALPAGTHIWVACGVTDMRKGFDTLAMVAQEVVKQSPRSGHVFVFRGKRADRLKILWWDGTGLCLYAKRMERGRFVWPVTLRRSGSIDGRTIVDVKFPRFRGHPSICVAGVHDGKKERTLHA